MPRFTKENARIFSRRGNLARANMVRITRDTRAFLASSPQIEDEYSQLRRARMRAQIERISDMLDRCDDPYRLDRLATVLERLCELERVMSGRPLPGSLRPSNPSRDLRLMRRAMASPMIEPQPPTNPSTNGHQPPAQAQAQASSATTSTEAPGAEAPSSSQGPEAEQATKPEQSEGEGTEGGNS